MEYPEGATPLDPNELVGLKFKHVTTRGELDHLEQGNIQTGLQWLRRARPKNILDELFVCELHKRLFGDVWKWAGKFRMTDKNIGIAPKDISVELRKLLGDVQYWIGNDVFPPDEIALRFHHRIVFIHLFPNGNGRHARIIADTLLSKVFGKPPINWTGGHDLQSMGIRRKEYIMALKSADGGDYGPLLSFAGILTPPKHTTAGHPRA